MASSARRKRLRCCLSQAHFMACADGVREDGRLVSLACRRGRQSISPAGRQRKSVRGTTGRRRGPVANRCVAVAMLPPRPGPDRVRPSLRRRSLSNEPARGLSDARRNRVPCLAVTSKNRGRGTYRLRIGRRSDRQTTITRRVVGSSTRPPRRRWPATGARRHSPTRRTMGGRFPTREPQRGHLLAPSG